MTNTVDRIAVSAPAATGVATGQEKRRAAPAAVYDVAPGLGQFTDEVLFGSVWKRTELTPRDRSLVTVSALVSLGRTAQIAVHIRRALDNGVQPKEIGELITHLSFYSGWPNAISAVNEVKRIFDEREIGPLANSEAARIDLDPTSEAVRIAAVNTHMSPTAPALADLTNRVLFGDLWQRPDLSARDRSLVTMSALVAIGQPEQLPFHLNRAMDNGLTGREAAEAVTHIAFYAGWPRAMSAVPVLKAVFDDRSKVARTPPSQTQEADMDIQIIRANSNAAPGPADYFTGEVRVSGHYKGNDPARIGGATVSFSAGARTAWHTHPLGQTLFVISGRGLVQKEGGPIETIEPGDVVWIPPHIKHWHGASANEAMSHFAVAEAEAGSVVTWMEKVSDEDYAMGLMLD